MDSKSKEKRKDAVVASMAKKLANVSTVESLEKIKKKRNKKPVPRYVIVIGLIVVISVVFYFAARSAEKKLEKEAATAALTFKDNPLTRLNDALNKNILSPDQYAAYCKDLLICFDSLPSQYKTDRPIVPKDDVYDAICNVWMQLYPKTKKQLTKELPGLSSKIEHYMDSLGLR